VEITPATKEVVCKREQWVELNTKQSMDATLNLTKDFGFEAKESGEQPVSVRVLARQLAFKGDAYSSAKQILIKAIPFSEDRFTPEKTLAVEVENGKPAIAEVGFYDGGDGGSKWVLAAKSDGQLVRVLSLTESEVDSVRRIEAEWNDRDKRVEVLLTKLTKGHIHQEHIVSEPLLQGIASRSELKGRERSLAKNRNGEVILKTSR
jgi:hypothetical protein